MRLSVAVLLLVAACEKPAPTCEATVRHAASLEPAGRVDERLFDELVEICTRDKWTASQRRCIVASRTRTLAARCASDGTDPRITEPKVMLEALEKAAKAYFLEFGRFPVGKAPLTPAIPCCASGRSDKHCVADPGQWISGEPSKPSPWEQLGFAIDEPHRFQYGYNGTAKSFTAVALGDLDCDGESMAYTLTGESTAGSPTFELVAPPAINE